MPPPPFHPPTRSTPFLPPFPPLCSLLVYCSFRFSFFSSCVTSRAVFYFSPIFAPWGIFSFLLFFFSSSSVTLFYVTPSPPSLSSGYLLPPSLNSSFSLFPPAPPFLLPVRHPSPRSFPPLPPPPPFLPPTFSLSPPCSLLLLPLPRRRKFIRTQMRVLRRFLESVVTYFIIS